MEVEADKRYGGCLGQQRVPSRRPAVILAVPSFDADQVRAPFGLETLPRGATAWMREHGDAAALHGPFEERTGVQLFAEKRYRTPHEHVYPIVGIAVLDPRHHEDAVGAHRRACVSVLVQPIDTESTIVLG